MDRPVEKTIQPISHGHIRECRSRWFPAAGGPAVSHRNWSKIKQTNKCGLCCQNWKATHSLRAMSNRRTTYRPTSPGRQKAGRFAHEGAWLLRETAMRRAKRVNNRQQLPHGIKRRLQFFYAAAEAVTTTRMLCGNDFVKYHDRVIFNGVAFVGTAGHVL